VAEAIGDEQLVMGLVVELMAFPSAIGGGVRAKIDRDIPDPAAGAADQLRLAPLQVDASQHGTGRAALVLLYELELDFQLLHPAAPEGLDEEAAFVAVDVGFDQDQVVDLGRQALHQLAPSVSP